MPFSRFNQLIESRSLYFSPASDFDDNLEGRYTKQDHANWDNQLYGWQFSDNERKTARIAKTIGEEHNAKATVISCWTKAQTCSSQMWETYDRGEEAIAIESSVGRLRHAVGPEFLFVSVRYIDENQTIPKSHSAEPFFFKRRAGFSWEDELRIVGNMVIGDRIGSPRLVPIDPQAVIQRVLVPAGSSTLAGRVEGLLASHALAIPVEQNEVA